MFLCSTRFQLFVYLFQTGKKLNKRKYLNEQNLSSSTNKYTFEWSEKSRKKYNIEITIRVVDRALGLSEQFAEHKCVTIHHFGL